MMSMDRSDVQQPTMTPFTQRVFSLLAVLLVAGGFAPAAFTQTSDSALKQADALYREGQAALARKDLSGAQADFERVVRLAPHLEQGYTALGTVLLQRGKAADAVRELEHARAISKADKTTEMNLALAYQQAGAPAKALPLFSSLEAAAHLQKQALPPSVLASYARALAGTGNLPQAASRMQVAVKADPEDAELHSELGSIYAQEKAWPEAQAEFARAVDLRPGMAVAHLRLGLVMQAQGEADSIQEISRAGQLAPNDVFTQLELGKALATSGQDDQAIPVLEHVLALRPDTLGATNQLALAYQRMNRVAEAITLLQTVVASEPKNATALTNLGLAYLQEQRAKDAVPVLQQAVALAPRDVTAHQDLAAADVQLSQFGDAAAELRIALKLAPDSAQLHYNLGLALKSQDDTVGAIPELERAEKLDPAAPEAPYLLGILYMQAGRYGEASRELQTSLRLRRANGDGWATLGSVYSKLDQFPEAVTALREAIKQLPQQPDPHLTLAAVLAKQGHAQEAVAERKQAAELMRTNMNRQRAEVATNAGNALLKSGDLAGATQQFQDALSYDPGYSEAHVGLASVFDAEGKPIEASGERQKAVSAPMKP